MMMEGKDDNLALFKTLLGQLKEKYQAGQKAEGENEALRKRLKEFELTQQNGGAKFTDEFHALQTLVQEKRLHSGEASTDPKLCW